MLTGLTTDPLGLIPVLPKSHLRRQDFRLGDVLGLRSLECLPDGMLVLVLGGFLH